jgi:hypothetical protein
MTHDDPRVPHHEVRADVIAEAMVKLAAFKQELQVAGEPDFAAALSGDGWHDAAVDFWAASPRLVSDLLAACNCYPSLLKERDDLLGALKVLGVEIHGGWCWCGHGLGDGETHEPYCLTCRAAIAKAEGRS